MAFQMPPVRETGEGAVRKVGCELEFAGVDQDRAAAIVQDRFGGRCRAESLFVHRVTDTAYGDFSIETDAAILKDRSYEKCLEAVGIDIGDRETRRTVEEALVRTARRYRVADRLESRRKVDIF